MAPAAVEARRQLFFVVEGALEIEMEGEIFRLLAGDAVEVPPGTRHRVRNVEEGAVTFLVVSAPSTRDDRVVASSITRTAEAAERKH